MSMPKEKDILLFPPILCITQTGDYKALCWTAKLFSLGFSVLAPAFSQQLPYFLELHSCTCSRLTLASGSNTRYISLPTPDNEVFQQEFITTRKCSCSIFTLLRWNLKIVLVSSIHWNSFFPQDKDGFPSFFRMKQENTILMIKTKMQ